MSSISFAMNYAKSHIEMYEASVPHSVSDSFDVAEQNREIDRSNCEAFLQCGIETFEWLIKADTAVQRCSLAQMTKHDPEIGLVLTELFRRWLTPCEFANKWIQEQYKRGYVVENLDEFRTCEREMRAIVESFDEAPILPAALEKLRDESLQEHKDGETAEFV